MVDVDESEVSFGLVFGLGHGHGAQRIGGEELQIEFLDHVKFPLVQTN